VTDYLRAPRRRWAAGRVLHLCLVGCLAAARSSSPPHLDRPGHNKSRGRKYFLLRQPGHPPADPELSSVPRGTSALSGGPI